MQIQNHFGIPTQKCGQRIQNVSISLQILQLKYTYFLLQIVQKQDYLHWQLIHSPVHLFVLLRSVVLVDLQWQYIHSIEVSENIIVASETLGNVPLASAHGRSMRLPWAVFRGRLTTNFMHSPLTRDHRVFQMEICEVYDE